MSKYLGKMNVEANDRGTFNNLKLLLEINENGKIEKVQESDSLFNSYSGIQITKHASDTTDYEFLNDGSYCVFDLTYEDLVYFKNKIQTQMVG